MIGPVLSGAFWIGVYLALVLTPLLVLLIGPVPPGGGFWWDLSMAFGFAGMAMMGVQFALTARFRRACAPFGIDIVYYFHRSLAVIAFALVFGHFLIVRIDNPAAVGAIDPLAAPWHMTVGRGALILFAVLIVMALWRKPLRIEYDRWRLWHALLATVALLLALGHIEGVGYYIQAPPKRVLWTAYTLFWGLLLVHVRLLRPWRLARTPYRVVELRKERGRVWTLALEPDGHPGMRFAPGQFAWITLRASPFRLKEHPFSVSSIPAPSGRLEFTIKELGDFTRGIGRIQAGEIAYVDGPYGVFGVDRHPAAPGFVFIVGGVGIAPVMSMLRALAAGRDRRPLLLFYGNRLWEHVLFREEIETLATRLDLKVVHVLGEPPADWEGERGFVTQAVLQRHLPANRRDLEYLVCGPTPMIRAAEQGLHGLRVPLERIHSEIFDLA